MAENIIIALCEGPHDVAFLHKILKTNSFITSQNIKLVDYPRPMNQLLIQDVKKSNVEELNLQTARKTLLPDSVLKKDNNYIFLYALGGDSKKSIRQKILNKIVGLLPSQGKIEVIPKTTTLNLLYFFDADEKGKKTRLDEIQSEIKQIIGETEFKQEYSIANHNGMWLGCYIFSDENSEKGKLEDLIIPIMSKNNESIFKSAKNYFHTHYEESRGKKQVQI